MIKIRKRYRVSLIINEIIEEPDKLDEQIHVCGAQTEMTLHTLDIVRGAGNGDHATQVLKHATEMLRHYVSDQYLAHTEKG
jgi:hypothetical protein